MHFRLQEAKKMVPAPRLPESGGSSPWWGSALLMIIRASRRQNPFSPAIRSARHIRGQRTQRFRIFFRDPIRRAI
jgi:hypothetical protein